MDDDILHSCATCDWAHANGFEHEIICVCDKSEHVADWVYPWDSCGHWKEKRDASSAGCTHDPPSACDRGEPMLDCCGRKETA